MFDRHSKFCKYLLELEYEFQKKSNRFTGNRVKLKKAKLSSINNFMEIQFRSKKIKWKFNNMNLVKSNKDLIKLSKIKRNRIEFNTNLFSKNSIEIN